MQLIDVEHDAALAAETLRKGGTATVPNTSGCSVLGGLLCARYD